MPGLLLPTSSAEMATTLADAALEGRPVRIAGSGTKGRWGAPSRREGQILISTAGLDELSVHGPTARMATVGAGVRLQSLQTQLAQTGQMLALDPPMGEQATIGGILATADSGPLAHRFGSPYEQVLAMHVALSDGSIARSGAPVLRNVAGYDLARLFCGSFGTLGVILSVTVRLRPLPPRTVTALALTSSPAALVRAGRALANSSLELLALDVAWRGGRGGLLARAGGDQAPRGAARAARIMAAEGLEGVEVTARDNELWARQRAGQRSTDRALVRIRHRPDQLVDVLAGAEHGDATLVGRATRGLSFLELAPERVEALRRDLAPGITADLLDRPNASAPELPVWSPPGADALALMRSVKAEFDPRGICNPGVFLPGI